MISATWRALSHSPRVALWTLPSDFVFLFFRTCFRLLNGFFPGFFDVLVFPRSFLAFRSKKNSDFFARKNAFSFFFPFAKVTVFLPREARLCFSESHGRAFRKRKKRVFCFFFFRESHGFTSARGTVVLS